MYYHAINAERYGSPPNGVSSTRRILKFDKVLGMFRTDETEGPTVL